MLAMKLFVKEWKGKDNLKSSAYLCNITQLKDIFEGNGTNTLPYQLFPLMPFLQGLMSF